MIKIITICSFLVLNSIVFGQTFLFHDIETGEPLANLEIDILDTNLNPIFKGRSDSKGVFKLNLVDSLDESKHLLFTKGNIYSPTLTDITGLKKSVVIDIKSIVTFRCKMGCGVEYQEGQIDIPDSLLFDVAMCGSELLNLTKSSDDGFQLELVVNYSNENSDDYKISILRLNKFLYHLARIGYDGNGLKMVIEEAKYSSIYFKLNYLDEP